MFRCAAADASVLAPEFPPLEPSVLASLEPFEAAVQIATSNDAVTVRTLPPAPRRIGMASVDEVLDASASTFGRDVAVVDAELRESSRADDSHESLSEKT